MDTNVLLAVIFDTVMVSTLLFASVRGGRPERIGVVINVAGLSATTIVRLMSSSAGWAPGGASILLIDLIVAAGFFWLGITTIRFWPIWAAGFALSNLFMSVLGGLLPRVPLFAYHSQLGIYAYLALGALALGTYRLPRNAAPHIRNGSRRSWLQHHKETN